MLDIGTACRTCMKSKNDGLVDLFQPLKLEDSSGCSLELAQALMECTATQVSKDDGLPQKLCEECVTLLQMCYTFRSQAQNAETEFKQIILLQTQVKEEKPELKPESFGLNYDDYDAFEYEPDFDSEVPKEEKEDKPYQCSKCNKQFSKENKFLKHLSTHGGALSCHICNKTFQRQANFEKHMKKHTTDSHTCSICSLSCESEEILSEHMRNHIDASEVKTETDLNLFKCEHCGSHFNSKRSLAMHKKKHKGKTKISIICLICDHCKKEFDSKSLLKRHLKIHSGVRQFQCPQCPKSYTRQDQFDQHLNKHKGLKPYICTHCSKGFTQLCSLKDHIRTHTRETPFLCSQCGKGFTNGSNLRQHMMRHSGLKPFPCSLCPKTFSTKGQMTCHMATHSGAHPFTCSCGARFTKPNSLKKHQLIHLDLRPHRCDECPMTFRCKDHLKRHYRIHTGEKPYKCAYCERAFTQSNDLVKHTRAHVGQNVYQCTFCEQRFRLLSELKQHYPTHYINGVPPAPPNNTPLAPPKDKTDHLRAALLGTFDPPPDIDASFDPPDEKTVKDYEDVKPERMITISFSRNILDKAIDGIDINLSEEKT